MRDKVLYKGIIFVSLFGLQTVQAPSQAKAAAVNDSETRGKKQAKAKKMKKGNVAEVNKGDGGEGGTEKIKKGDGSEGGTEKIKKKDP
jgi:hypothetical protein